MQQTHSRTRRGFSLLELMVVILIMGVLSTIVGINIFKQQDKAKVRATQIQIETVAKALRIYKLDHDEYPPSGRLDLVEGELDGEAVDAWKRRLEYYYPSANCEFMIISNGKDGIPQTEDDIVHEQPFDNQG